MCDTNRINYTAGIMQILAPTAICVLGSYCMNRMNKPWATLIGISATNASNLNRLRTAMCCISISAIAQSAARITRSPTGHRTGTNLVLDAVSVTSFAYLIITGKIHSLVAFVIFGTQMVISNIYVQKQMALQRTRGEPFQQQAMIGEYRRESLLQLLEGRLRQMIDEAQDICKQPIVNESDIKECIESCECLLKDLNERDRVEKEGFNPMNEVASKLKFFWKALIQELPRNLRYDHTINFIEALNKCNYFFKGELEIYLLPQKSQKEADLKKWGRKTKVEAKWDADLKKWGEKRKEYFQTKWKILRMRTLIERKDAKKDLEGCLKSKNRTVPEKLDLLDMDLLRNLQLLGNEASRSQRNGLFNEHKTRYAEIQKRLTEGEQRGNYDKFLTKYNKFLTKYGLGPEGHFLSGTL